MKTIKLSEHKNYLKLSNIGECWNKVDKIHAEIQLEYNENLLVPYSSFLPLFEQRMGKSLMKKSLMEKSLYEIIVFGNLFPVIYRCELYFYKAHYTQLKNEIENNPQVSYFPLTSFKPKDKFPSFITMNQFIYLDNRVEKRHYFLSIEQVLTKLNISLDDLSELIKIIAIRPILYNFKLKFYSFQVDEILNVLENGSPK